MEKILISDAIEAVQSYLDSQGKSRLTKKAYSSDIKMFAQDMKLTEVDKDKLEATAAAWLNAHRRIIAPRSTSRRLTSMRTLGVVYGLEILRKYSAPSAPQLQPHPLPEGPTDLAKLLDHATNDKQRALIALLGLCGLRIGEALDLRPQDVDLKRRTIKVYGKGSRYRIVEMSDAAHEILFPFVIEAQLDMRTKLVNYADRSARHIITALAQKAEINKRVASHDLRATFATAAYHQSGNDVRVVQDLLGHASLLTTQGYIGTNEEERREAVEFMGVLL